MAMATLAFSAYGLELLEASAFGQPRRLTQALLTTRIPRHQLWFQPHYKLEHMNALCNSFRHIHSTADHANSKLYEHIKVGIPLLAFFIQSHDAYASEGKISADTSSVLASTAQLIYLGALLALICAGGFFVIRQVLLKRELETAAKELQERARTGEASSVEYFELGAVMLRKKLYTLAAKYLDQAIRNWEGDEQDLAQVYNALGFTFFSSKNVEQAIVQYEKAVKLSPGYVVAWNNLGNAYEKKKEWAKALKAYEQTLQFDPDNKVALACCDVVRGKLKLYRDVPTKVEQSR